MRPRLLDLFCGAGGCSVGYHRAGFDVIGVDLEPQPNYPYPFVQADALRVLDDIAAGRSRRWPTHAAPSFPVLTGNDFAAIHASPPCQAHSTLKHRTGKDYVDLVAATRELLEATGLPYVQLCGSSFGLGANGRQLRRHRLFECNFPVMVPPCQHQGQPIGVYGTGGGGQMTRGYKGTPEEYREAMGIDWATRAEIAQAIPPAYTEHLGSYLMAAVNASQALAA
jgi:DNA (cytosine-5)-methyltransferase 1